ncbi:hypothetical protein EON76_04135 [bacterium]|nr:MAG: hypothetical protein EON76_04135 [bacterium]
MNTRDSAEIDSRYFVDEDTFNCAFCKRNNIPYSIPNYSTFDWSNEKRAQYFTAKCSACNNESLHLTFVYDLVRYYSSSTGKIILEDDDSLIDDYLIYSQPTSFFTLDASIPRVVRDYILDAENSVQMNLLTGASATLRKAVYTLLKTENSLILNEATKRTDYKESIKELKEKFSFVDSTLFDSLAGVQGLTSNNVHEDAWESWDRKNIKFLIELTKDILTEMYVIPAKRKIRLAKLAELKIAVEIGNNKQNLDKVPKSQE